MSKTKIEPADSDGEADAFFETALTETVQTGQTHNLQTKLLEKTSINDQFAHSAVSRIVQSLGFTSVSSRVLLTLSELLDDCELFHFRTKYLKSRPRRTNDV
jgi:hypothetical protein